MAKHTPEPWLYQEKSDDYTHIVRSTTGKFICQLDQDTSEKAEVNARIIATAPDGYALANYIIQWAKDRNLNFSGPLTGTGIMLAKARALITKAEKQNE